MQPKRHSGHFDVRFARHLWGLTRLYWTSRDAARGTPLLVLCVALELALVYANVELAWANSGIFDALQRMAWPAFLQAIELFLAVALVVVFVSAFRIYVRNILQIRWREGLTAHFIGAWMGPYAYGHQELHHDETDNPDQRIAQDIQSFVASALGLSLSLLSAIATLVSFVGMLWTLSGTWPLRIGTTELWIPGLMMWVALLYAFVSMYLTHRVGRSLVGINFDRLRFEADFRYNLVRFRDNIEAVALARGESVERRCAMRHFRAVVTNWGELIRKQRDLSLLTGGIGQANGIVPLLVAAPAFFAGRMTLGGVTQTGIAYAQVSGALSWFVDAYQEIAAWRASIERLATFRELLDQTRAIVEGPEAIHVATVPSPQLRLVDLTLATPAGTVLAAGLNGTVAGGERVTVVGPAGTVKTILFRAIAGIWPFGHGRIEIPANVRSSFLGQHPYLPLGTLREALSYPAAAGTFSDAALGEALESLGLGAFAARLDETESWHQTLSTDEQQRLVFASVLLHRPEWLIMDDTTAGLDDAAERRIYDLLARQLPSATILSITSRQRLVAYHQRRWELGLEPEVKRGEPTPDIGTPVPA